MDLGRVEAWNPGMFCFCFLGWLRHAALGIEIEIHSVGCDRESWLQFPFEEHSRPTTTIVSSFFVFVFCHLWNAPRTQVKTPALDSLVTQGLELDRMYAYKYCSPTRSSLLSGRLPIHVTQYCNYESVRGAGTPVNMTLIADKLSAAGYRTMAIGKWDIGSASHSNMPVSRGFDHSLHYFEAAQDHYTQVGPTKKV